jgi:hypothetical protein
MEGYTSGVYARAPWCAGLKARRRLKRGIYMLILVFCEFFKAPLFFKVMRISMGSDTKVKIVKNVVFFASDRGDRGMWPGATDEKVCL